MEIDKQKHRFISMALMIVISIFTIAVLTDGWFLYGESKVIDVVLGLIISAVITFLIGAAKELVWDKWLGKGVSEWGDMAANLKGIGRGAIIIVIIMAVLKVISLF